MNRPRCRDRVFRRYGGVGYCRRHWDEARNRRRCMDHRDDPAWRGTVTADANPSFENAVRAIEDQS